MDLDYHDPKVKQVQEVYQLIRAINKTTAKLTQKNAENLGLTLQQLAILNTLFTTPKLTQHDLAEQLISSKSTISVSVDKLVKMGLVERNPSEEDRREVRLHLTEEGKELSKKSSKNALFYKAMLSALEKMPDDDIKALLRIQKDLLYHLKESGR